MGEMIERVARAINPDAFDDDYQKRYLFKAWQDEARVIAFKEARSSIEAMRKPTESMFMAAWEAEVSCSYTESAHAWDAMINAALK